MLHEDTFNKSISFSGVKGLIYIGDKIIAYRRDTITKNAPGCIDLPGGGRENDESPFETFKREVMEEFGIPIEQSDIVLSVRRNSHVNPGTKSFFMVTKPLKIDVNDIVFGDEGTEWFMISPHEFAERKDGIERQQKRVSDYLKGEMMSE